MKSRKLSCGELMKRICDIFEARANKDLLEHDVTLSQMKMLIYLNNAENSSAALKEIEKYFGTAQATTAGIALRLEKKGLIESYIDSEDRRIKHVSLSAAGAKICSDIKSSIENEEARLLKSLSDTESCELQRLLRKIYDGLQ